VNNSREYTTGFVTSKDGTKIGYRQMGKGEVVILVHGGLQASQSFMALARAMSDEFTVYVPDRRGRGLSGGYGNNYNLSKDGEDIQALVHQTKAQNIFGLSSGAIITLQTAIGEPGLKKVALYEPPLIVDGVNHPKLDETYERALVKGNLGKALISVIKGTGDSSLFAAIPAFITAPFINFRLKKQEKRITGDNVPIKALIPTFHYDRIIVNNAKENGILGRAKHLKADVLLLGGSKSQKFLTMALDKLNAALPQAKRVEFKGLGHTAASNDGKPALVAAELKKFFKQH
jgi:pimeloyl-ACP methyl ester carboxylesterase